MMKLKYVSHPPHPQEFQHLLAHRRCNDNSTFEEMWPFMTHLDHNVDSTGDQHLLHIHVKFEEETKTNSEEKIVLATQAKCNI